MAYAEILNILETTRAVKLLPYSIFIKKEDGLERTHIVLPKNFPNNLNDPLYSKINTEMFDVLEGLTHLYSMSMGNVISCNKKPFYDLENESAEDLEALEKIKETYVALALVFTSKTDEPTLKTSMEKAECLVDELKKLAEELDEHP